MNLLLYFIDNNHYLPINKIIIIIAEPLSALPTLSAITFPFRLVIVWMRVNIKLISPTRWCDLLARSSYSPPRP